MTKRTEQQEVDQRGEGILTAQLGRYVVNDFDNDFGIDFAVNLTESGEDSNYKSVQGDHFGDVKLRTRRSVFRMIYVRIQPPRRLY